MRVRGWMMFLLLVGSLGVRAGDEGADQFFETRVRPVLVEKCHSCHSGQAKKLKARLYLDSREGVLKGGDSGPAVVAGAPEKSRLIEAVSYKNVDLAMPPKEKLSDGQIADLTAWVKMGAPWPATAKASGGGKVEEFDLQKRKGEHWAWRGVVAPVVPSVTDRGWVRDPIDAFVLAKLEGKGLRPAMEADRGALIRRVYFDLIGLPPAPEEVKAFVDDSAPEGAAWERVVDGLLASPRFGERWGRHWLDLMRYAETMGHEFDYPIPHAWRYRDYVIRAFNEDVPYDRFVVEHIAGDLIERPRRSKEGYDESVVGTASWYLGEGVHSPVDVRLYQADCFDNRIDVLGKAFVGMTVACARCHDHKFDAISTADYYGLYGFLKGTRYSQRAVNERQIREAAGRVDGVKGKMRGEAAREWLQRVDELAAAIGVVSTESDGVPRLGDVELARAGLDGWSIEGSAFERCGAGDFALGEGRVAPVAGSTLAHSGLRSVRLEGALRSSTFVIDRPYLHVRVAGKNARLNVVIDNYVVIRDPIYGGLKRGIDSQTPVWITIDLTMWKGRQAYLEFLDKSVGDLGGPPGQKEGWVALHRAVLSEEARPPAVKTSGASVSREFLRETIELWRDGKLGEAADSGRRADVLVAVARSAKGLHSAEYPEVEAGIPAPLYVPAAHDGSGDDEHVFIRGNPKNLGQRVARRFIEALGGASSTSSGSGRLELARAIVDPANPLTARVMMNRVWHHLFGRGIVASVDNFGVLGEMPSHPELLDHLTDRFVQDGWSVKRLIRGIVVSSAYRMSSRAGDERAEREDPMNVLLHRQNVRRLEGEAIRDSMLAVSGRLDLTMGGPGVAVHITPFMEGRGRPSRSGPLDGEGRRSVYLEVRRNFLSPMLLAFDMPIPLSTMGRRSVSNVPAQALILMNDPLVGDLAKLWAKRVLAEEGLDARGRVERMYLVAFARLPSDQETASVLGFVERSAAEYGAGMDDVRVWTDVAHALMNVKEFVFVN